MKSRNYLLEITFFRYQNLLRNLYTFPQKETYNWKLSIRPDKDTLLNSQQQSEYFFYIDLIFDITLTKDKALELLITHKSDLETLVKKVVQPNIQNSLNQLGQTLSLGNFSNQKEQIEKLAKYYSCNGEGLYPMTVEVIYALAWGQPTNPEKSSDSAQEAHISPSEIKRKLI